VKGNDRMTVVREEGEESDCVKGNRRVTVRREMGE
jgi:hypothetical protein